MRFKARGVFLALVAVFAMSAVAASAASAALPEFKRTSIIVGKGGSVTFETQSGALWQCQSTALSGKITGPKTVTATLKITGCYIDNFGNCETITTSTLTGTLGYIHKATKQVGLSLQAATGETFGEFICTREDGAKTHFIMKGALVGALTPVNKATTEYTLTFSQERGKEIGKFEEGLENPFKIQIGEAAASITGMETSDVLKTEVSDEIEA